MEIWKDVIEYEGLYKVSNWGRIKSLGRKRHLPNGEYFNRNDVILSQNKRSGYLSVNLFKNKESKSFVVHRLVAIHFVDNPYNKKCVNHKDGDKENNYYINLEWVTVKENSKHASLNGLYNSSKGEKHYKSKLKKEDVLSIRKDYKNGLTQYEIADKHPVTRKAISLIVNRHTWKHI